MINRSQLNGDNAYPKYITIYNEHGPIHKSRHKFGIRVVASSGRKGESTKTPFWQLIFTTKWSVIIIDWCIMALTWKSMYSGMCLSLFYWKEKSWEYFQQFICTRPISLEEEKKRAKSWPNIPGWSSKYCSVKARGWLTDPIHASCDRKSMESEKFAVRWLSLNLHTSMLYSGCALVACTRNRTHHHKCGNSKSRPIFGSINHLSSHWDHEDHSREQFDCNKNRWGNVNSVQDVLRSTPNPGSVWHTHDNSCCLDDCHRCYESDRYN